MSDTDHAAAIRDVNNLTVQVEPGTLVRTPDGRVWCRHEPEIGGWEIVPSAVVEHLTEATARAHRLRRALDKADERLLSRIVEARMRADGKMPSREWVSAARGAIISNHYAEDGLEPTDLDAAPGDTEGE